MVFAVVLLCAGVAGAIGRPRGAPAWFVPAVAAALAVATGTLPDPASALRPLAAPIAFLLCAVPLATLLERVGFFDAAARTLGHGRHLALGLWVLGAVVTTILNLDAAIVLLTPLYAQIARRCGIDPLALAIQPVLLSCLASSALPVSNLTNLIAASARHLSTTAFLAHLGLPSLAATVVGWFVYSRVVRPGRPSVPDTGSADRHALVLGAVIVTGVLLGFVIGPGVGLPEWATALSADAVLVGLTRQLPVRNIPWGVALVAAALGLLAAGAAAELNFHGLLDGSGNLDYLRITAVSALGANAANNLPALLVLLPRTGTGIWALLLGVNVGPLVLVTGTLAALLWQAGLQSIGIPISAAYFTRIGLRVMPPALVAAFVVLVLLRPIVGG